MAGGVGANKLLRKEIAERFEGEVYYPRLAFCTDNGAMIAIAGALRLAEAGEGRGDQGAGALVFGNAGRSRSGIERD